MSKVKVKVSFIVKNSTCVIHPEISKYRFPQYISCVGLTCSSVCNSTNYIFGALDSLPFFVVYYKALLASIQAQKNHAFPTFPSGHSLWTDLAPAPHLTVKWPMSTVVIAHIWWWLLSCLGVVFILRHGWW